jgi:hypothetical protein
LRQQLLTATRARIELLLPPRGSKSKAPLGDHLREIERRTGRRDRRLEEPELPSEALHTWDAFWRLYEGRPVTFSEMRAWSELTGALPTPWEAETIRAMSFAAVKEASSG